MADARRPTVGGVVRTEATYQQSPWSSPIDGLDAIGQMWDRERVGPGEEFTMDHELVALDVDTAVVRVAVEYRYDAPSRWRDIWIIQFGPDGRCVRFEEWPFAAGQPDGH